MNSEALNFGVKEWKCVSTFNRYGVRFLVVGGYAVRFHGHMRDARDVDVLVGNDHENSVRLCAALTNILGAVHPNIRPDQFEGRKRQANFEQWGLKFEILSAADGINFSEVYSLRLMTFVNEIEVPIMDKRSLIAMKRTAGRKQDLADIAALEAI